ncbi:hypothetical protein ACA910_005129 [Epithemia clementina (nom. ined.)]
MLNIGGEGNGDDLYAWSSSTGVLSHWNTSNQCANHLTLFFDDPPSLAIAAEASSHPSGLVALEWQPWTWAGGGLGNIAECPLQTCIAGAGIRRDSLTFASLCIVPECTARDLVAYDFLDILSNSSVRADDVAIGNEYTNLVKRITELNHFLGTGWTCGDFLVPWQLWPLGYVFMVLSSIFVVGVIVGSFFKCASSSHPTSDSLPDQRTSAYPENINLLGFMDEEKKEDPSFARETEERTDQENAGIWTSFDLFENANELFIEKHRQTAILDGLKVGSICWIILGHVMAITGSVAGFSNPKEVYPPTGYLASFAGQLILSSRFAVETFLIISGFLTFHVLNRKLPPGNNSRSVLYRYLTALPKLFAARAARVLPLYLISLLFYTQIAPHMGGGPFWYQWISLLKPCHDYFWTNLLFVNNFIPLDNPTTETCFYHSWYLAVDMQLFLLSAILIIWHQKNHLHGKRATAVSWILSMALGTYLAMERRWSINTFDGAAVARYDAEGYAKPHIRAQSYLTGVFVAMILPDLEMEQRLIYSWNHRILEFLALFCMGFVSFITYAGANSRRACQYQEWPSMTNCGSEWSETADWIYASMSRTVWCLSTGTLMHLFLGRPRGVSAVAFILSWKIWAPLSRLSFAVYLIHPILIFMWELGSTEKEVFRPSTFGMNVLAVCVVSYLVALVAVLIIEIPATKLLKYFTISKVARPGSLGRCMRSKRTRTPNAYHYGSLLHQDDDERHLPNGTVNSSLSP